MVPAEVVTNSCAMLRSDADGFQIYFKPEAGHFMDEPVLPNGKALGPWKAEGPRFESASTLLYLQTLWSVDTVL